MFSGIVWRINAIGSLYEEHRELERAYERVLNENSSLFDEVNRMRDVCTKQEAMYAVERQQRMIAEAEKEEVLRMNDELHRELSQLQHLINQAAGKT